MKQDKEVNLEYKYVFYNVTITADIQHYFLKGQVLYTLNNTVLRNNIQDILILIVVLWGNIM